MLGVAGSELLGQPIYVDKQQLIRSLTQPVQKAGCMVQTRRDRSDIIPWVSTTSIHISAQTTDRPNHLNPEFLEPVARIAE